MPVVIPSSGGGRKKGGLGNHFPPKSMNSKKKTQSPPRLGKLAPLYQFVLNPYPDVRFTTCPDCSGKTLLRKIPLAVHVNPHHPTMLNKHCRYCPKCDLLICHQDELEDMLVQTFQSRAPDVIGNDYLVMGTFDKATWRHREKELLTMGSLPEYLHDFKEYLHVEHNPAHWGPADEPHPPPPPRPPSTLDDPQQVEALLAKMEAQLPLRAEIHRATARYLAAQGVSLPPHRQITISHVVYSGDEGGIMCAISPEESKEPILISLTHLKIPYHHPLEKEIRAYQKARMSKLAGE